MTTVTLSLISHTNVGKTTLARTLLRREIGEVRDQPHVTTIAEAHPLIETDDARLLLWDTPGFGDTVRLMTRLRREGDPIGWFLHQVWDRVTNRALWCSQEAVRNVRSEADVVLYLVNATEDPLTIGYLAPELELLSWMGRPVLVLLNQVGTEDPVHAVDRWRNHVAAFPITRGVLTLDAFNRAWVEESLVLERVVELLDGDKRAAMERLLAAWNERNLRVFEHAMEAIADYLAAIAVDREPIGSGSGTGASWVRALSRSERDRAMSALFDRVQVATRRLMDRLIELHQLAGSSKAHVERRFEDAGLDHLKALAPTIGGVVGGMTGGLAAGLGADVLAGGMTFGGGAAIGALLGALGGAALGGLYRFAAGGDTAIQFQDAALDGFARAAVLRYLVVAHYGRGRGDYADLDHPAQWTAEVDAELVRHREALHAVWHDAARAGSRATPVLAERLRRTLREMLGGLLRRRYPGARVLVGPAADEP